MPTLKEIVASLARLAMAQSQAAALLLSYKQKSSPLLPTRYLPLYGGGQQMTGALNSVALAGSLAMRNLEWIKITYSAGTSYSLSGAASSPSNSDLQHNISNRSFPRTRVKRGLVSKNVPLKNNNDNNGDNDGSSTGGIASSNAKKLRGDNNSNDKVYGTDSNLGRIDSSFLVHKSAGSPPEDDSHKSSQKEIIAPFPNVALLLHNSLMYRYQKRNPFSSSPTVSTTTDSIFNVVKRAAKMVTTTTTTAATMKQAVTAKTSAGQGQYSANSERVVPFLLSSALALLQRNTITGRITTRASLQNKRSTRESGALKRTLEEISVNIQTTNAQPKVYIGKAEDDKITTDTNSSTSSSSTRVSAFDDMLKLSKAMQLMISGIFVGKLGSVASSENLHLPTAPRGPFKAVSRSSLDFSPTPPLSSLSSSSSLSSTSNYLANTDGSRGILPLYRYTSNDASVQADMLTGASTQVPSEKAHRVYSTRHGISSRKEAMKKNESRKSHATDVYSKLPLSITVSRIVAALTNAASARTHAVDTTFTSLPPSALVQNALLYRTPVRDYDGDALNPTGFGHTKRLSSLAGRLSEGNSSNQQSLDNDSPETSTNPISALNHAYKGIIPNTSLPPLTNNFSRVEDWNIRYVAIPFALHSSVSVAFQRTKQAIMQGARLSSGKDAKLSAIDQSSLPQMGFSHLTSNRISQKTSSIGQQIRHNERNVPVSYVSPTQRTTRNNDSNKDSNSRRQKIRWSSSLSSSSLDPNHHSSDKDGYQDADRGKVSGGKDPSSSAMSILTALQETYANYTLENMLQKANRSTAVSRIAVSTSTTEGGVPFPNTLQTAADIRRPTRRNRKNSVINPRKMLDSSADLPVFSQQVTAIFASNSSLKTVRDTAVASAAALSVQQIVSSSVPSNAVVKRSFRNLHSNSYPDGIGVNTTSVSSRHPQSYIEARSSRNTNGWNTNNNNSHRRLERNSTFSDKNNTQYQNAGKELSLRTLRKMIEQIFQDELKRYGL